MNILTIAKFNGDLKRVAELANNEFMESQRKALELYGQQITRKQFLSLKEFAEAPTKINYTGKYSRIKR